MNDQTSTSPEEVPLEEDVQLLVQSLPAAVQKFVTGSDRARVTLQLTQKYSLHVDQAATFEHAFIFMLLGVYTPEQFVQELRDDGLPEDAIQGLTKDVNEQVFIPLRSEELNSSRISIPSTSVPSYKPEPTASVSEFNQAPAVVPAYVPPVVATPPPIAMPVPVSAPMPLPSPPVSTFATPIVMPEKPAVPTETTANREALGKIMKEYGVDPYREPTDEK